MTDLTDDKIRALLDAATEGPWSAERDLPYNRMPRVHSDTDRSLICECGNVGTTQDQWEANARLIAAAPDLAAARLAAREEIERLRARVKELEAGQEWQPMETAPKDGREILLRLRCDYTFREWTGWVSHWSDDYATWCDDGDPITNDDSEFEGWMPLPAPPKEGE